MVGVDCGIYELKLIEGNNKMKRIIYSHTGKTCKRIKTENGIYNPHWSVECNGLKVFSFTKKCPYCNKEIKEIINENK